MTTPASPSPSSPPPQRPHPPDLYALDHTNTPQIWSALLTSRFPYKPSSFLASLHQMFEHPEHNTSWILRSDTLTPSESEQPRSITLPSFATTRTLLRRFVPRNPHRDAPALQSCHFLTHASLSGEIRELVVYLNHCDSAESTPYYLPKVRGVAWLLFPASSSDDDGDDDDGGDETQYCVSLLYSYFNANGEPNNVRLERTAHHLLSRAIKLAGGIEAGYEKRVHHDLVIPREEFQDRYLALRAKHATRLVGGWREKTDPRKHVFEDILIATFLICLWERMYQGKEKKGWMGFVDIGCGNGVLVDVLLREGWTGSGFDARARKSWDGFEARTRQRLREMVLVPYLMDDGIETGKGEHDGRFEEGTFIISNHTDELTPWTPILAAASNCPFIAIPCCSHDLSGAKKRFPPPKDLQSEQSGDLRLNMNLSKSTYASLCAYVERIARECGWVVEREVLRIPSTRNVAVIGRRRKTNFLVDVAEVVRREGGATGWRERVEELRKKESICH
ncbi:hypothetical protein BZA05DRAFT_140960 [Tricharina praecox]|uniref:uncharacterized protein n=1 Tax=Tricharina praecox TaxID=43433 RepID=UPI00221F04E3|nr:uncharacterized protein BZA05DRAFT_140960 [Tricharina praecox]KAI5846183.1 hypothetical protein BZA05DRAFT_140960 [Tricharina praecox]